MSTGDILFQLVSSMRRDEKRHFSKHAAGHRDGPTNYVKLFRSISSMEEYDEDELREQFKGTKLLRNLPSEKRYLYTTLLKVLRMTRYDQGARNLVIAHEEEARILLEKSLYAQAIKRLEKATKIARSYELLPEMLRILEVERTCIQNAPRQNLTRCLEDINSDAHEIVEKLANLNFYRNLYDQMFQLVNANFSNSDEKIERLVEGLSSEKMSTPQRAMTFEAKRLFHQIRVLDAFSKGDMITASEHYLHQISLWEEHNFMAREYPRRFVTLLYNYAGLLIRRGELEELAGILAKLEKVKTRTADEAFVKEHTLLNLRLQLQMNIPHLDEALKLVPAFEDLMEHYAEHFTSARLLTIYHNLAMLMFMCERYDQTLEWMNRILQENNSNYRQDIIKFAFLIQPVIYFELFDSEMPDNLYRSIKRALRKSRLLRDGEAELIKKLCDLGKTQQGEERQKRYVEIRAAIDEIYPQVGRPDGPLGIVELRIWLEHKITKNPMNSIYTEWHARGLV